MKKTFLYIVGMLFCQLTAAQTLTSYVCDFENPQEMQNWTINAGARGQTSINKWYRGAAGSFGLNSQNGFYISTAADTTVSAYDASTGGFVVAYRPMTLAAGTYTLVYDWIGYGQAADGIYVCWVPATTTTNSNYGNNTTIGKPNWLPGDCSISQGSSWWQSATATFTADGSAGKLVVVFYYTKGTAQNPSFAIDNISIFQGTCTAPSNVRYDGNTVSLSWTGSASGTYDVLVFNNHTKVSTSYVGVQGTTCQLSSQTDEGMYYFYVRQTCDAVAHSVWVFTKKFVWVKDARCIDLFDLGPDQTHAGVCYVGDFDTFIRYNRQGTLGMVDNGYASNESMHTIHIEANEKDPNTHVSGGLRTIPNGEIASVRLGAYTSSGQSARIEYKYTVTPGMSDLLDLKYAVVMQSGGHGSSLSDPDMNPTFTLNILDGSGNVADACVQRYFVAGYGGMGSWHQEGDWWWCDWSTITVSLRRYVGQTITLRFTSTRCSYDTHPAYAYFTFNCRGGDLQGVACGDYNVDHFQAPDGFDYRWYKASDPSTVLSDSSFLGISNRDTAIYCVDLLTKGQNNCYYTLTANPNPRGPKAKIAPQVVSANCENNIIFTNTSAVMRTNRVDGTEYVDTTEHITSLLWDFGDGSPVVDNMAKSVTHQYPDSGGRFEIKVVAGMSGDVCLDTFRYVAYLPNVHATAFADSVSTCADSYRDSHGRIHFAEDGDFIDSICTFINMYGCSADSVRKVSFQKEFLHVDSALICENEAYRWYADDKDYRAPHAISETTDFTFELRDISMAGCDSVTRLILTVNPIVRSDLQENAAKHDTLLICPNGDNIIIPYELYSGLVDSVVVTMAKGLDGKGKQVKETFEVGDPVTLAVSDTLRPDIYTAYVEFKSEACPAAPVPVVFETMYLPRIVQQKDGFIALLNENYNYGHYKFDQYQWYRDGMPIVGAITSYIVVTPEDLGHIFFVILRREGEERFYRSCDFMYTGYTGLEEVEADSFLEVQKVMYEGRLYIIRDGKWYDALGREIKN